MFFSEVCFSFIFSLSFSLFVFFNTCYFGQTYNWLVNENSFFRTAVEYYSCPKTLLTKNYKCSINPKS